MHIYIFYETNSRALFSLKNSLTVYPSMYLFIYPSIYLSFNLFIYLSIHLNKLQPIYLSIYLGPTSENVLVASTPDLTRSVWRKRELVSAKLYSNLASNQEYRLLQSNQYKYPPKLFAEKLFCTEKSQLKFFS